MRTIDALTICIGAFAALAFGNDAPELCGTCWCTPEDATSTSTGTCPEFGPGLRSTLDPALVQLLESFVPAGTGLEAFKLQSDQGGDCNPLYQYAGVEGVVRSDLPKCVDPDVPGDDVSCAMVFPDGDLTGDASCCGRKYELVNFVEGETTIDDPYAITHKGHCGVCSTAQDLALSGSQKSKGGYTIDQHSTICASTYHLNANQEKDPDVRFDGLVKCFEEEVGYSSQCAKLWASYVALATAQCFSECVASPGHNEGPPLCEYSACVGCTENASGETFYKFMGRTSWGSGYVEPVARSCAFFTPNDHDYCEGSLPAEGTCDALSGLGAQNVDNEASVATQTFGISISALILSIGFIFLELKAYM